MTTDGTQLAQFVGWWPGLTLRRARGFPAVAAAVTSPGCAAAGTGGRTCASIACSGLSSPTCAVAIALSRSVTWKCCGIDCVGFNVEMLMNIRVAGADPGRPGADLNIHEIPSYERRRIFGGSNLRVPRRLADSQGIVREGFGGFPLGPTRGLAVAAGAVNAAKEIAERNRGRGITTCRTPAADDRSNPSTRISAHKIPAAHRDRNI